MLAAGIIIGLIAWIVLSAYVWSWVVQQAALSEEAALDYYLGEVKADAERFGAGVAKVDTGLLVTNTNQFEQDNNSTSNKPPVTPGRIGK